MSPFLSIVALYVNGSKDLEHPNKLERKKERKKEQYAASKRCTLALKTHIGWEWGDGKRHFNKMATTKTKTKQKCSRGGYT